MESDIPIESMIRDDWFKDHIASYEKLNDSVSILNWQRPGTSFYKIRYVLDNNRIYISGDCGEAVYVLTEKASLDRLYQYDITYFTGKLACFCEEKYDFDSQQAIERLNELKKEFYECETVPDFTYDHIMFELIEAAGDCTYRSHWHDVLVMFNDQITDYYPDLFDTLADIGNQLNCRLIGYLIGLKMAFEQIKQKT